MEIFGFCFVCAAAAAYKSYLKILFKKWNMFVYCKSKTQKTTM